MSWFDRCIPNGSINAGNLVCGSGPQYQPKAVWPELVGSNYLVARQIIQRDAPWAQVIPVMGNQLVLDTRFDRIYIVHDGCGCVVAPPKRE